MYSFLLPINIAITTFCFIHSSVDGHWGYFLSLAVMSNAAVNIDAVCILGFHFSLGLCLGIESYDNFMFNLEELPDCFPR
jgi:hypothetical protein